MFKNKMKKLVLNSGPSQIKISFISWDREKCALSFDISQITILHVVAEVCRKAQVTLHPLLSNLK